MAYHTTTDNLLANGLNNQLKKAGLLNINDNGEETLDVAVNSISFSNVGTTEITLIINGGESSLPVGATVSFDAGGAENRYPANTFAYNTTEGMLLIAYTW